MSIKDIVRREEEEVNGNWIGATLAVVAFMFAIVAIPKYVTKRERSRGKY